jgi:hypothetical protein
MPHEKQTLLQAVESALSDHRQIIDYDRIVQKDLESFKQRIERLDELTASDRAELGEQLEQIALLVKDLAVEEQRLLEESPAVATSDHLEDEAHSYFRLSAALQQIANNYFRHEDAAA